MNVTRTTVPGVGERFELEGERRTLVVVCHHDGRRELFRRDGDTTERLCTLDSDGAHTLGAVLVGAFVQPEPADDDRTDAPLDGAVVEWVEVGADAALVGERAADVTVARVVAVQRSGGTLAPDAAGAIEAGDTLVAVGSPADHRQLAERA